jgi:hypothetical protein
VIESVVKMAPPPDGPCPGCFGAGVRVNLRGQAQICECRSFPAALAEEWSLPEYVPGGYDSLEEAERDED